VRRSVVAFAWLLVLPAILIAADAPEARPRRSAKGWELFSWKDPRGTLHYALVQSGAFDYTFAQVLGHDSSTDLDVVRRQLEQLASGEHVRWSTSIRGPRKLRNAELTAPDPQIVRELEPFCAARGLAWIAATGLVPEVPLPPGPEEIQLRLYSLAQDGGIVYAIWSSRRTDPPPSLAQLLEYGRHADSLDELAAACAELRGVILVASAVTGPAVAETARVRALTVDDVAELRRRCERPGVLKLKNETTRDRS
jgi:hypothetical protein